MLYCRSGADQNTFLLQVFKNSMQPPLLTLLNLFCCVPHDEGE